MAPIKSPTLNVDIHLRRKMICPVVVFALIAFPGCDNSPGQTGPTRNARNSLKQISVLFGRHAARNGGTGPKDEAEFRKFITEKGQDTLKAAAVASVDELLISPRDNEPFEIRYGMKIGAPKKAGGPIVAYEKTGVGGSRLAVDSLGKVTEASRSELEQLLKN